MFGVLATVSADVEHAIGRAVDSITSGVSNIYQTAQQDAELGGVVQTLRTDVANIVAGAGAAAVTSIAGRISPTNAPAALVLTATTRKWLLAIAAAVVLVLAYVLWRRS